MRANFVPALNQHGLFVHAGAKRGIDAFIRSQLVGYYPMYLVGMAMPEHRAGPAVVALLTLPDGGVLSACARSLGKKQRVNGVLGYDVDFLGADELQRYRTIFYSQYGGFTLPCLEVSPTAAAESLLLESMLGLWLGPTVAPSPQGPPNRFPSDWTDVVYYSQKAIACTVEGFAPSADAVAELELPSALIRAMQLSGSPQLQWMYDLEARLVTEVDPSVPSLLAEAWALRVVSPQASVALLRSVGELVARRLGATGGQHFNAQLLDLEKGWRATDADKSPAGRRERARRESVLACFHTMRDLGNRIHADSRVSPSDVALAHSSCRRLLEAVLRVGPLDQPEDH